MVLGWRRTFCRSRSFFLLKDVEGKAANLSGCLSSRWIYGVLLPGPSVFTGHSVASHVLQAHIYKHPILRFLLLLATRLNPSLHQDLVVIELLLSDLSLLGHYSTYQPCGTCQQDRHVPCPSNFCSGSSCQRPWPTSFFQTNCLPAPSDNFLSLILTKWRLFTMSHYPNVPRIAQEWPQDISCYFSRCVY